MIRVRHGALKQCVCYWWYEPDLTIWSLGSLSPEISVHFLIRGGGGGDSGRRERDAAADALRGRQQHRASYFRVLLSGRPTFLFHAPTSQVLPSSPCNPPPPCQRPPTWNLLSDQVWVCFNRALLYSPLLPDPTCKQERGNVGDAGGGVLQVEAAASNKCFTNFKIKKKYRVK